MLFIYVSLKIFMSDKTNKRNILYCLNTNFLDRIIFLPISFTKISSVEKNFLSEEFPPMLFYLEKT